MNARSMRDWSATGPGVFRPIAARSRWLRSPATQTTKRVTHRLLQRLASRQSRSVTSAGCNIISTARTPVSQITGGNFTYSTNHSSQPACLYSALHAHHPTRSFMLSITNLLSVPFVHISFGTRCFSTAAPKI